MQAMCDNTPYSARGIGSLVDSICHQRSASDDLLQAATGAQAGDRVRSGVTGSNSMRRSVGSTCPDDGRPVTRIQSMSAVSGSGSLVTGAQLRRDRDSKAVNLPVQLLSTTNEQKGGQVPQQLPLKLASPGSVDPGTDGGGSGAGGPACTAATAASSRSNRVSQKTAPPSQQPRLLIMPSSSSQVVHSPTGVRPPPTVAEMMGAATAALSQRTSSVTVGRVLTLNSPQNVHYHPAMMVAGVVRTAGHTAAQSSFIQSPPHAPHPALLVGVGEHFKPPRLVSTQSTGNILPMKLAERPRPKSASAQQSPVAQKRPAVTTRTTPPGCEELHQPQQQQQLAHSTTTSASKNINEKRITYF